MQFSYYISRLWTRKISNKSHLILVKQAFLSSLFLGWWSQFSNTPLVYMFRTGLEPSFCFHDYLHIPEWRVSFRWYKYDCNFRVFYVLSDLWDIKNTQKKNRHKKLKCSGISTQAKERAITPWDSCTSSTVGIAALPPGTQGAIWCHCMSALRQL